MAQDRALQAQQETIRIPVYGNDEYDAFGQTMDQVFINCYPEVIRNTVTGEGDVKTVKRPGMALVGLDLFATTGAAARSDLHPIANMCVTQLNDVFVCAIGDVTAGKIYIVQYRPIALTSVLIGTLSSVSAQDCIHITEAQIASAGTIYPSVTISYSTKTRSASKCYYALSNGTLFTVGTLTQITAAAFPDQLGSYWSYSAVEWDLLCNDY
jgi:hypothetical protein